MPIITAKAPQVKKLDQFDKEPSYLKRHLLTAMPTPSPIAPFQSKGPKDFELSRVLDRILTEHIDSKDSFHSWLSFGTSFSTDSPLELDKIEHLSNPK